MLVLVYGISHYIMVGVVRKLMCFYDCSSVSVKHKM